MSYLAIFSALKRLFGWLTFGVLVFTAISVSLVQILLANIPDLRKDILAFASENYRVELSLSEIRGTWRGLNPRLYLSDLTIGAVDGEQTHIDVLEIELDPLASLLKGSWVVSHFYGSGLDTAIKLQSDGRIQIAGIPSRENATDPDLGLDLLVYTGRFTLNGMKIRLSTEFGSYSFNQPEGEPFELVSQQELKTLSMVLDWTRQAKDDHLERTGTVQLIGEFSGDPRQLDSFYSKSYIKITPFQLHDVIPAFTYRDIKLNKFLFSGEFWLTTLGGEFDLTTEFNVPELELVSSGKPVTLAQQFSGRLRIVGRELLDWRARLDEMSFVQEETTRSIADLQAIAFKEEGGGRVLANLGARDLGNLSDFLLNLGPDVLPGRSFTILESMYPRGSLAEAYLDIKVVEGKPNFRLLGHIEKGELNAYLGSPMIDNIDSVVSVGPRDLWIDVHNGQYQMRFASIFDDVWGFDSASGRVKIQYPPGLLTIGSDLLTVRRAGMTVSGKFHLNLDSDRLKQTWGLILGVSEGDASEKSPFLPNNLSPALREWLDRSVVKGQVVDAGLLFHGSLSTEADRAGKLHEYYFRVADSELDYHPDWPFLTGIQALINGGNWGVSSSDVSAVLQDCVLSADVLVPFDSEDQTSFVKVKGVFSGESQSVLDFIKESPVADMTNRVSSDWLVSGPVRGDFDLAIPINYTTLPDGSSRYRFDGSITGQLDSVKLNLPAYNLVLENIESDLSYTANEGFNSEHFKASLFDFPITGQIHTTFEESSQHDSGAVQVDFSGKTDIAAIRAWSNIPLLAVAEGESTFTASLVTPFGAGAGRPYFSAYSELVGIGVELPEPLGKTADIPSHLQYQVTFGSETLDMNLDFGAQVKARLKIQGGHLKSGVIAINSDPLEMPAGDGLRVSGVIDRINFADWTIFNERLAAIHEASTGLSYSDQFGSMISQISIETTDFQFRDVNLPDLALVADRKDGSWSLSFDNDQLAGAIVLFDDESQPMEIDLNYLRLTRDESDVEKDPLAGVSPDLLQPARFKVGEFLVNGENYGSWQFNLEPRESHIEITDLYAAVKGFHVHGEGEAGATLDWITGEKDSRSMFKGRVSSPNFSEALIQWGLAPSIEGEEFKFGASISWPGSPAMIARSSIEGRVNIDAERGRFVQATGGGPMKLLGIFDFASLARRFRLDFSDVSEEGYEFNRITGEWRTEGGTISVTKPISIEGASSSFKIGGEANMITGDISGDMIVTLPVSRNLPWYSALMVSPVVGAGVYLVQKVFEDQIDQFSSAKYQVTGTIDEPVIEFVNIFNNTVREDLTPDNAIELPKAEPADEVTSP